MKALGDHRIDAGHVVGSIVGARILVLEQQAELLAIGRAAAVVVVEDDIAFRRIALDLGGEMRAIGSVRAAVNFEEQRILLRRVETGRGHVPALDFGPVVR